MPMANVRSGPAQPLKKMCSRTDSPDELPSGEVYGRAGRSPAGLRLGGQRLRPVVQCPA